MTKTIKRSLIVVLMVVMAIVACGSAFMAKPTYAAVNAEKYEDFIAAIEKFDTDKTDDDVTLEDDFDAAISALAQKTIVTLNPSASNYAEECDKAYVAAYKKYQALYNAVEKAKTSAGIDVNSAEAAENVSEEYVDYYNNQLKKWFADVNAIYNYLAIELQEMFADRALSYAYLDDVDSKYADMYNAYQVYATGDYAGAIQYLQTVERYQYGGTETYATNFELIENIIKPALKDNIDNAIAKVNSVLVGVDAGANAYDIIDAVKAARAALVSIYNVYGAEATDKTNVFDAFSPLFKSLEDKNDNNKIEQSEIEFVFAEDADDTYLILDKTFLADVNYNLDLADAVEDYSEADLVVSVIEKCTPYINKQINEIVKTVAGWNIYNETTAKFSNTDDIFTFTQIPEVRDMFGYLAYLAGGKDALLAKTGTYAITANYAKARVELKEDKEDKNKVTGYKYPLAFDKILAEYEKIEAKVDALIAAIEEIIEVPTYEVVGNTIQHKFSGAYEAMLIEAEAQFAALPSVIKEDAEKYIFGKYDSVDKDDNPIEVDFTYKALVDARTAYNAMLDKFFAFANDVVYAFTEVEEAAKADTSIDIIAEFEDVKEAFEALGNSSKVEDKMIYARFLEGYKLPESKYIESSLPDSDKVYKDYLDLYRYYEKFATVRKDYMDALVVAINDLVAVAENDTITLNKMNYLTAVTNILGAVKDTTSTELYPERNDGLYASILGRYIEEDIASSYEAYRKIEINFLKDNAEVYAWVAAVDACYYDDDEDPDTAKKLSPVTVDNKADYQALVNKYAVYEGGVLVSGFEKTHSLSTIKDADDKLVFGEVIARVEEMQNAINAFSADLDDLVRDMKALNTTEKDDAIDRYAYYTALYAEGTFHPDEEGKVCTDATCGIVCRFNRLDDATKEYIMTSKDIVPDTVSVNYSYSTAYKNYTQALVLAEKYAIELRIMKMPSAAEVDVNDLVKYNVAGIDLVAKEDNVLAVYADYLVVVEKLEALKAELSTFQDASLAQIDRDLIVKLVGATDEDGNKIVGTKEAADAIIAKLNAFVDGVNALTTVDLYDAEGKKIKDAKIAEINFMNLVQLWLQVEKTNGQGYEYLMPAYPVQGASETAREFEARVNAWNAQYAEYVAKNLLDVEEAFAGSEAAGIKDVKSAVAKLGLIVDAVERYMVQDLTANLNKVANGTISNYDEIKEVVGTYRALPAAQKNTKYAFIFGASSTVIANMNTAYGNAASVTLVADVEELLTKMETIDAEVAKTLEDALAKIEESNNASNAAIKAELAETVADLTAKVDAALSEEDLAGIKADIADLVAKLDALDGEIEEVETELKGEIDSVRSLAVVSLIVAIVALCAAAFVIVYKVILKK